MNSNALNVEQWAVFTFLEKNHVKHLQSKLFDIAFGVVSHSIASRVMKLKWKNGYLQNLLKYNQTGLHCRKSISSTFKCIIVMSSSENSNVTTLNNFLSKRFQQTVSTYNLTLL